MSLPLSGSFGRALLLGHGPLQMGMKTSQRTVTTSCVNGAAPMRGESDKPPSSQI